MILAFTANHIPIAVKHEAIKLWREGRNTAEIASLIDIDSPDGSFWTEQVIWQVINEWLDLKYAQRTTSRERMAAE